jgi:phage tail-like protein
VKAHLTSALALATVLAAAVSGVALAEPGDDEVHACVNDASGAVRIADECRGSETELTWNRTGPQGPAGPEGPAGPPGPAGAAAEPATYLGSHALYLDGRFLGALHSVEGCGLRTEVQEFRTTDPDGQIRVRTVPGAQRADDCWVEAGLGLDPRFYDWLAASLESGPTMRRAEIVVAEVDGGAVTRSWQLENAWPSKIEVSPVVEGSGEPAFLRVRLTLDEAEKAGLTGQPVGSMEEHPIDPTTLQVEVEGAPVAVDMVRGLSTEFEIVETRTTDPSGHTVIIKLPGDRRSGPLTAGATDLAGEDYLHAWYDALAGGPSAFRAVRLSMASSLMGGHTLTVEIPRAWASATEPFPRLDGRTRATLALDPWTLEVS